MNIRDAARRAARRSLEGGRRPERDPLDPFGYDQVPAGEYNSGCRKPGSQPLWAKLTPEQRRQWALLEPEAASGASSEQTLTPGRPMPKGPEVPFSYPCRRAAI